VAGCCECGDEPSGSCATELVNLVINISETPLGSAYLCQSCRFVALCLDFVLSVVTKDVSFVL
jgi:hypothetical protein